MMTILVKVMTRTENIDTPDEEEDYDSMPELEEDENELNNEPTITRRVASIRV